MSIRTFGLLVLWIANPVGYIHAIPASAVSPAQSRIDAISRALAEGRIAKTVIIQIPGRIATRTQVTPEVLEKQFNNEVIIGDITQTAYRDSFVTSFQTIHAEIQLGATADLRWRVIFYSRLGARLGAVYFDKFRSHGAVDKFSVSFRGKFFSWLQDRFSRCLQ